MQEPPEGNWHYELITPDLYQTERIDRVYFDGRTQFQHVVVQEGAAFGRSLVLDGKTQSTEVDEFVYHEGLVHPSMIAHEAPRTGFVAGGGEGATIREALRHSTVESVVMVDIDRKIVELCREYLPNHHRGAFDDPRLSLIYADAKTYLESTIERFDVIIIDVPDPMEASPAYPLFTREFYTTLLNRLRPGGIMACQSGPTGPSFFEQCFSAVANTVASVFPVMTLSEAFVPSFGSTWGFVIGSMGPNPAALEPEEVDARIAERVSGRLRYFDGATLRGMVSVPKYLRESVERESRIITLDDPLFVV